MLEGKKELFGAPFQLSSHRRPILALSLSFHLVPGSSLLDPTGLYLPSLLNEEMTDLICDLMRVSTWRYAFRAARGAQGSSTTVLICFLFGHGDQREIRSSETRVNEFDKNEESTKCKIVAFDFFFIGNSI